LLAHRDVPVELIVSCGTGAFREEKRAPKLGWDAIITQIVNSATDGEATHEVLKDLLVNEQKVPLLRRIKRKLVGTNTVKTKYYRCGKGGEREHEKPGEEGVR
jgi:hypothetical protein